MKYSKITIIFITICSCCFGQSKQDTVSIYWPNNQLKYRTVCCFIDTTTSPDSAELLIISTRRREMWDENGNEIDIEDYLSKHMDIVVLEGEVGLGEDEIEYRDLISYADKALELINSENLNTINEAIKAYVEAKEKIPDAVYPKQKLQEIQKMIKN